MKDKDNIFEEGSLRFRFARGWKVNKYDNSSFYRGNMIKVAASKAVDFLAKAPDGSLWMIEVKDFRGHRIENKKRLAAGELVDEVVAKVRDTIAGLWLAHVNQDPILATLAIPVLRKPIQVILWLEEDRHGTKLNPFSKHQLDTESTLRSRLRPIGLRGCVGSLYRSSSFVGLEVENISTSGEAL